MDPTSLHTMPMLLRVLAQMHSAGRLHTSPDRAHLILPRAINQGVGEDLHARIQRVGRRHVALRPYLDAHACQQDGVLLGHIQDGDAYFCPRPFKDPTTRLTEPVVIKSLRMQAHLHIGPTQILPDADHDPARVYPFWSLPYRRHYAHQPWTEPLQYLAMGTGILMHARHTAFTSVAAPQQTARFVFTPPTLTTILDPRAWPRFYLAHPCAVCLQTNPFSDIFNTTARDIAQAHGATLDQFLDLFRTHQHVAIPSTLLDHNSAHARMRAYEAAAPVREWAAAHGLDR